MKLILVFFVDYLACFMLCQSLSSIARGIEHDFTCLNICKVPREVLKTEGFLRDHVTVNHKIMFDRYCCINSTIKHVCHTLITFTRSQEKH